MKLVSATEKRKKTHFAICKSKFQLDNSKLIAQFLVIFPEAWFSK